MVIVSRQVCTLLKFNDTTSKCTQRHYCNVMTSTDPQTLGTTMTMVPFGIEFCVEANTFVVGDDDKLVDISVSERFQSIDHQTKGAFDRLFSAIFYVF